MSIVSLAVLTLSSTNITWLLFVYIVKILLSIHLHIVLMFFTRYTNPRHVTASDTLAISITTASITSMSTLYHSPIKFSPVFFYQHTPFHFFTWPQSSCLIFSHHFSFAHHMVVFWFSYQFLRINFVYSRVQYPPEFYLWVQPTSFFDSNHNITLYFHLLYYISTMYYFSPALVIIRSQSYPK